MTKDGLLDAVAKGQSAKAELALVGEIMDSMEAGYTARMRDVAFAEPWASQKISNLAVALKVVVEVRHQLEMAVANGTAAESELIKYRNIEAMSPERRRILGIALR